MVPLVTHLPRCLHVGLVALACLAAAACSPGYYPDREAEANGTIVFEPLEVDAGLYIDSERFEDDYLGRTIRVPGAISRISEGPDGARDIELGNHGITEEGAHGHVVCELNAGPQVGSLAVGDRITVEGRYAESIPDSGTRQIRLTDCELAL